MKPDRLIEADLMRAAAILLILVAHMPAYTTLGSLADFEIYFVTLGLSLFVFISGYCLARNERDMSSWRSVAIFWRQRFVRIYPLYVPALLLFIFLFHYLGIFHKIECPLIGWKSFIHLCSCQEIVAPRHAPLVTLWFVGAICMYYLVYAALARVGGGAWRTIAAAVLIFALCLGVQHSLGVIGNRFFIYYPPFVAGIAAAKAHWMEIPRRSGVVACVLLAMFCVSAALLWDLKGVVYDGNGEHWLESTYGEMLRLVFSLSGVFVAADSARLLVRLLPRSVQIAMIALSAASYAIYLYHRPLLALMYSFNKHFFGVSAGLNGALLIAVGLPALFVVCHHVQQLENLAVQYVRTRRWTIANGSDERCTG
jgi:peptidoglycan/LPS O-acetylase OafA/YrhL